MNLRDALRLRSAEITDEAVHRDRRRLLAALGATPALGLAGCAEAEPPPPPKASITPAQARAGFKTDEELTRFEDVTSYNNFYEFGTGKLDPSRAANRVTRVESDRLHGAIVDVLRDALAARGTSFRDYRDSSGQPGGFVARLAAYGREGQPCLRCGARLVGTHAIDGRATVLCARCQH